MKRNRIIVLIFSLCMCLFMVINIYNNRNKYTDKEYLEAREAALFMWKKSRYYSELDIENIEYEQENHMYYIYIQTKDGKNYKLGVDMEYKNEDGQYKHIIVDEMN